MKKQAKIAVAVVVITAFVLILLCQGDNVLGQRLFVIRPAWRFTLCRSMLPQHPAYPSLGY